MAYLRKNRRLEWPPLGGAIVVTALVGAVIVTGLNVKMVSSVVERLKTFNVEIPKPPPPPPPPPPPKEQVAKREQGVSAKKAEAKPVVAPKPVIPLPAKQSAPTVAGNGSANSAGAGTGGNGTGAGGSGTGLGGGGTGSFIPARKITKIPDSQYRRFTGMGMSSGRVGVSIRVNPDGSASDCRVVSSSGNPSADSLMCQLTEQYVRFSPARDPSGRAIGQQVTYYPDWHRR